MGDKKEEIEQTKQLDDSKIDELFEELKTALKSKRPQKCKDALQKFYGLILSSEKNEKIKKIASLIDKYKFAEALEIL